ncbi:MAG: hypothetical protein WEE50_08205 [Chloroflexota bacterium]
MAGYVASARLQGGVPRFVGGAATAVWRADGPRSAPTVMVVDAAPAVDHVELVGRPLDEFLADWLASVGESWSQLTFFLFDPDSWR